MVLGDLVQAVFQESLIQGRITAAVSDWGGVWRNPCSEKGGGGGGCVRGGARETGNYVLFGILLLFSVPVEVSCVCVGVLRGSMPALLINA